MDDKLVYAGSLAKQIAEWKKHIKSENQDYLIGYICGLSVVEGIIADMPAIPAIPVEWLVNLKNEYAREGREQAEGDLMNLLLLWKKEQGGSRMAEWKEVIHNVKRICERRKGQCGTCRLGAEACPNNARFDITDEKEFDRFAEEVMLWAAENPEPVYPTWWKYMCMIGVIPDELGDKTLGEMTVYSLMNTHIQSDTAQKLGLEPRRQ